MMWIDDAQHFVRGPEWTWYILGYFFFAGLTGGSYFLASLLRLFGKPEDEPAARIGYYVAFAALLPCPVLLTLDLGQPLRFWHMLVNTTPGQLGLNFKYWSPMSVGAWALTIFGAFATWSFLEAFARDRARRVWRFGKAFELVGALLGLFVAAYTGVLLSVSNQPVWSDTWTLGGLFLASGLSGSAALMGWLIRFRRAAEPSAPALAFSERWFQVLELALIVALVVTLYPTGALERAFGAPWFVLWAVVLVGLVAGLASQGTRASVSPDGTVAVRAGRAIHAAASLPTTLVLVGVIALRAAIIFSAQ